MSKRNVLVAIDRLAYDGKLHGGGRYFLNVVCRINPDKFSVVACVLRNKDSSSLLREYGVNVTCLGRNRLDPLVVLDLVRLIKKKGIDILHLHSYGSHLFGRIAAILSGVPTIVHGHGLDYSPSTFQKFTDLLLNRYTAKVITVSTSVGEDYIKRRKISPQKLLVLPNGIRLEDFAPVPDRQCRELKKRLGIEPECRVIGTVTRFREEKGNQYFLQAAKQVLETCPETFFLLVGDGPLRQDLMQLAVKLGIQDKVLFAGYQKNVRVMLSLFDVKVIASISEGHPLALLEAMAMGKPVVAANVGGIKEILEDSGTGLLVPPGKPVSMAEKIIQLLQNEKTRLKLGKNALKESRKYDLDAYVQKLERIYDNTIHLHRLNR